MAVRGLGTGNRKILPFKPKINKQANKQDLSEHDKKVIREMTRILRFYQMK